MYLSDRNAAGEDYAENVACGQQTLKTFNDPLTTDYFGVHVAALDAASANVFH